MLTAPVQNSLIIVAKLVRPCYGDVNGAYRGDGLGDGSEQQLAEAMIRLYGRDAESVAMGHAETHADMGDPTKSDRWRRIADAIADIRGGMTESPVRSEAKVRSNS